MGTTAHGRPRVIDPAAVSLIALRLFTERGFDGVSIDEIAEQAGVSRRSLFRLFPTKAALVWGGFDEFIERIRASLSSAPMEVPGDEAVQAALVSAAAFPASELEVTRRRLLVIHANPSLASEGATQHLLMTGLLAQAMAERDGARADDLLVEVRAAARAAVATAALIWWALHSKDSPETVVERAFTAN